MHSALFIVTCIFILIVCGLFIFYYRYFLSLKAEVRLLHFHKQIYFHIASNINDSQSFDEAVNLFVSVLAQIFDFGVCSYTVKTNKEIRFKAYLNKSVNVSYIKTLQTKSLQLFSTKAKIQNLNNYHFVETVSGFPVSNELDITPSQIILVPIKYKNLYLGVFAISFIKNDKYSTKTITKIKILVSETFQYIFELQELGKSGTAKEEYTNMIIHDLRAPLTIIQGSADILIKRKAQINEEMRNGIIEDMKNAAKRLLNIVDNLLDIARLENGKFKIDRINTNMSDFLKSVVSQYKLYVEDRGLKYKVILPKSTQIICNIDPHIIERVFDNLISNACKYTKKGSITVRVDYLKNKHKLKVSITDSGVGIAKDKQKLLFNKFEQIVNPVDSSSKSTGLGLVVSKKLVEENGGKIGFKSKVGVGSTFYFTLPVLKKLIN